MGAPYREQVDHAAAANPDHVLAQQVLTYVLDVWHGEQAQMRDTYLEVAEPDVDAHEALVCIASRGGQVAQPRRLARLRQIEGEAEDCGSATVERQPRAQRDAD